MLSGEDRHVRYQEKKMLAKTVEFTVLQLRYTTENQIPTLMLDYRQ